MRTLPIIALLSCSSVSLAGVVMQMENRDLGSPNEKPDLHTYYFQDGAFRQEETGASNFNVFRNLTMYTIDAREKSFRKIDKAQMQALAEQLGGMRTKLAAQLKNLPPAQREQMEQAMGQLGGGTKAPVLSVRDAGRNEAAAGISCRVWEVLSNGKKETEVCIAAPASVPDGAEMMKSMREIGEFVGGLANSFGGKDSMTGYWSQLQKLNGVPVLTRDFDSNGKPESEQRVLAVKSSSLPAALFQVPAGYTEKKFAGFDLGAVGGGADDN